MEIDISGGGWRRRASGLTAVMDEGSCFHTVDLARRNAARVLLVRSNTIRQDLMWRKDGSSRMTL
jgi:hypothetical protein